MNTFFALFMISTLASLIITPLIRRFCQRLGLLDVPTDGRRLHTSAIPRLGGVALYLSCAVTLSILPFVDNLLTQDLRSHGSDFLIALVPATLVLLLGVYDDLRGTNAVVKFAALGLIAALFFAMGGRIAALSIPFVGSIELPLVVSFFVTVFWLVGIANAFNLIDGMDGLASGAALFSSLVILAISFAQGQPVMIVFALVLCGSLAGFLRYNFNPASIFLGDSGALFVGFSLAALSVLEARKATTAVAIVIPVLAFGLPVVDTAVTITRRMISRKPLFQGDSEHIHHMLLARGWSQQHVALVLYGACAAFGLTAIVFTSADSGVIGLGLFVLGVVTLIAVGHLRYHEVDELRAGVKRTVGDRRVRVANNIRVRRAALALTKSSNLHELFDALAVMLDFEEFAYANLQIGEAGRADVNERAFNASTHRRTNEQLTMRNGRIAWSWKRNGLQEDEVIGSSRFWCFRLPLSSDGREWGWINLYRQFDDSPLLLDMNYLTGFLRTDLAAAVSRILQSHEKPARAARVSLPITAGKTAG